MSATMLRLAATRAQDLRPLLPMPPAEAHAALQAEAQRLSPAHAALFAQPVAEEGAVAWAAPGARMARYADLDAASRATLAAPHDSHGDGRVLSLREPQSLSTSRARAPTVSPAASPRPTQSRQP